MIIQSDSRQSKVEFVGLADQEHRGFFQVSTHSEAYWLTNPRVFLEKTSAFVNEVVLTGTEDFQFSIEPDGRSGAI